MSRHYQNLSRQPLQRDFPVGAGSASHGRNYSPVSRNYSPDIPLLIPLLFRCYGPTSSAVRAEFIAGPLRGERGFSAVPLPRGFQMRRGERRSAMLSQFENPMIFLLKISKCGMNIFLVPKGTRLADCPCRARKCLKTLKTARAGYWLK